MSVKSVQESMFLTINPINQKFHKTKISSFLNNQIGSSKSLQNTQQKSHFCRKKREQIWRGK